MTRGFPLDQTQSNLPTQRYDPADTNSDYSEGDDMQTLIPITLHSKRFSPPYSQERHDVNLWYLVVCAREHFVMFGDVTLL